MRFRATIIRAVMAALLLPLAGGRAQEGQPSEYQVKAAFVYHFAQLISWPPSAFEQPKSPMMIGILGDNPFGDALEVSVRGKAINGHPVMVRMVRSLAEATNTCHVLFISSSEKRRLSEIFAGLRGSTVLTVGETDRFTEAGGMVNFVREGTKIRFQINDSAAKKAGLKVSSKLLALASPGGR